MDHVAIVNKKLGMLPKILTGEKTVESRWYMNKSLPWGKIKIGETIYFKNSGEPITVKSKVLCVNNYENLTPVKIKTILDKYNQDIGGLDYELIKNKKYCILIFLGRSLKVDPIWINKKRFGTMAAWICIEDINKIKKSG